MKFNLTNLTRWAVGIAIFLDMQGLNIFIQYPIKSGTAFIIVLVLNLIKVSKKYELFKEA